MSSKQVKDLQKIAELLRHKLTFLNKGIEHAQKEVAEATQQDVEINSDSEREALELFGNVNPPIPNQKENVKSKDKKNEKPILVVKVQQSNLKSILRKQINMDEEPLEQAPQKDLKPPSTSKPNQDVEEENEGGMLQQHPQPHPLKEVKDEKEPKYVTFSFQDNIIFTFNPYRKWNQPIENQKKGKFQPYQQKILSDAIGQYLATNEIRFQQFVKCLSVGNKEEKHLLRKEKFFKLLASALPNRSPMSCYKFVRRNFNSLNHQGEWTAREVQRLKDLVDKMGRKWTLIGKELGRTSDNVYDKYRSLGEQGLQERVKSLWKLKQLVEMLLQIERQTEMEFIDHNIKKELQQQALHDGLQQKELKEHRYNSKQFTFHNIELIRKYIDAKLFQSISLETIKWKKIVRKVPTKNIFDCRNKVVQILQVLFRNNQSLDEALLKFLQQEKPTEESKLDWKKWRSEQYAPEEARNRFMIVKKLVQGRTVKAFDVVSKEIIAKLKKMLEKSKEK